MHRHITTLPPEILTQILSPCIQDHDATDVRNFAKVCPLFSEIVKNFKYHFFHLEEDQTSLGHYVPRSPEALYNFSIISKILVNPSILKQARVLDVKYKVCKALDYKETDYHQKYEGCGDTQGIPKFKNGQMCTVPESFLDLEMFKNADHPFYVRENVGSDWMNQEPLEKWSFIDAFKLALHGCTNLVEFHMDHQPMFISAYFHKHGIPPALRRLQKLRISHGDPQEFLSIQILTCYFTIETLQEIHFKGVRVHQINIHGPNDQVEALRRYKQDWRLGNLKILRLDRTNLNTIFLDDILSCPESLVEFNYHYSDNETAGLNRARRPMPRIPKIFSPHTIVESLIRHQANSLESLTISSNQDVERLIREPLFRPVGNILKQLNRLQYLETDLLFLDETDSHAPFTAVPKLSSAHHLTMRKVLPSSLASIKLSISGYEYTDLRTIRGEN